LKQTAKIPPSNAQHSSILKQASMAGRFEHVPEWISAGLGGADWPEQGLRLYLNNQVV
jgi:hypothetical protein